MQVLVALLVGGALLVAVPAAWFAGGLQVVRHWFTRRRSARRGQLWVSTEGRFYEVIRVGPRGDVYITPHDENPELRERHFGPNAWRAFVDEKRLALRRG